MANGEKYRAFRDFIDHYSPDFVKNFDYFRLRKQILDDPSRATIAKVKRPIRFAAMGAIAPFALYFGGLTLLSLAGIPTIDQSIESEIAESRKGEQMAARYISEADQRCSEMEPTDLIRQSTCKQIVHKNVPEMRESFAEYRGQLELAQNYRNNFRHYYEVAGWISFIISCYIFAYLFNRLHPLHSKPTPGDFETARNTYLVISGITLFFPSCFAVSMLIVNEIFGRISPLAIVSVNNLSITAGGLPLLAGSILVAGRTQAILLGQHNWRIGRTFAAVFVANAATNAVVVGVLILISAQL